MRIIGLDLSLSATGLALPFGQLETIKTRAKDGDARLCQIRAVIARYVAWSEPEFAVIEKVPNSMRGGVITIVRMALVHGVVRELLALRGVPYGYVAAASLKKYATGRGTADKDAMIAAAESAGGKPADDNQADAFWCRTLGTAWFSGYAIDRDYDLRQVTKDWPGLTAAASTP